MAVKTYTGGDQWYWYKNAFSGTPEIPPQALPINQKNKAWREATVDALERVGIKQVQQNLKFQDYYRMIDGRMAYSELSETAPQLREIETLLDNSDIPSWLKHYDILGIIINSLVGEYMNVVDNFVVTNIDEISSNEYERHQQELLSEFVQEAIEKEVLTKMIRRGINPFVEDEEFESDEQRAEYIQYIQQMQEALTPPEIKEYMTTKWTTVASKWGQGTLDADHERFYMDELDRKNLIDFFATGRTFRGMHVGYDHYRPEHWSVITTFFSQEADTEYVQDGEFVGRIEFKSAGQIINQLSGKLTKAEKDLILGTKKKKETFRVNYGSQSGTKNPAVVNVPHKQHFDYEFMLNMQNHLGVPMGRFKYINANGEQVETDTFLSESFQGGSNILGPRFASSLREDIEVRKDLFQLTEVYWRSYREVGLFTYMTETGEMKQEVVTDEILTDLIKELGITQLRNVTLEDAAENPQENTIVWDYVDEIWHGYKVSGGMLDKPLYVDIKPLEYQIKGDSNLFTVQLPVSGVVSTSLANKIQPYQVAYNVLMNQAYNLIEKELGVFFLFDFQFLPSEMKNWGDTEDSLLYLRNLVKDIGFLPVDSSKGNLQGGAQFNQFSVQDMTLGRQIAEKLNLAEMYKQKALEQVGFNQQRLGEATAYMTAEGVRNSQQAQYNQTQIYFDKFYQFKKRTLEQHLTVAQYVQGDGKDLSVYYMKSDSVQAYLHFQKLQDPHFPLRRLGLMPVGNPKHQRDLQAFKQYMLSTNTMDVDPLDLARFITSDTTQEVIEIARRARMDRQEQEQSQMQHQQQLITAQAEAEEEKAQRTWEREEYSKQKERETKLDVARIQSLGRALDANAEPGYIAEINRAADHSLKREQINADIEVKQDRLEFDKEKEMTRNQETAQKFNLEMERIKLAREQMRAENFRSMINKD